MCGIAGIITPIVSECNEHRLKMMADAIAHRGPDGEGFWINNNQTVGLAHRRLAIIDLSEQAAQPMHYLSRYTIVYNGEIYNFPELKKELKKAGYHFNTSSDTEVILAAYDCYKEKCLPYFDGMFAFAIWDSVEQKLFAARDRLGEKPFYYHKEKAQFSFASEMKSLWAIGISKVTDNKMLLNYLTLGTVNHASDSSRTFFNDIFSLPAAHYLTWQNETLSIQDYWQLDKQITSNIDEQTAMLQLKAYLNQSVTMRLRSDVPVGTSLSGGLDSSSIVASIMQQQKFDLKTFSAVFPGFEKDESAAIQQLVSQFNIKNYQVTPTAHDCISDFEKLMYHQEEPFTSSSVYAQYRVYQMAKTHQLKVLLDGQGADELFAGYHKYAHWFLQELINKKKFQLFIKEQRQLKSNHVQYRWDIRNVIAAYLPSHVAIAVEKKAYAKMVGHPDINPEFLACTKGREWDGLHKPIVTKLNDSLYFDVKHQGLEALLRYADRNAMAHGCEVRLPFLQHDLVKFAFSLPSTLKIQHGFLKSILRKTMQNTLPESIVWNAEKIAFEPPQKSWMEEPSFIEYLHESKKVLVKENILKPSVLKQQPQAKSAYEADNSDWRYLCAAKL
jgi:asparagine synthase (glutamine-hydrolysing)